MEEREIGFREITASIILWSLGVILTIVVGIIEVVLTIVPAVGIGLVKNRIPKWFMGLSKRIWYFFNNLSNRLCPPGDNTPYRN